MSAPPVIVDAAAIAEWFVVSKATVHKWRQRQLLPAPDYLLSIGPIWKHSTIRRWGIKTGRLSS